MTDVRYWHKADIAECTGECPLSGVKRTSPGLPHVRYGPTADCSKFHTEMRFVS